MAEGLGYPGYAATAATLVPGVTARLAQAHPEAVAGIHLANPGLAATPPPWTSAEDTHFAEVEAWTAEQGGYAHQQATKPSTFGAALHDSPAGLAAWSGEKIVAWSSITSDGRPAFDRDLLLGTPSTGLPGPSPPRCSPTGPAATPSARIVPDADGAADHPCRVTSNASSTHGSSDLQPPHMERPARRSRAHRAARPSGDLDRLVSGTLAGGARRRSVHGTSAWLDIGSSVGASMCGRQHLLVIVGHLGR
jgi:hypothetical protein